MPSSDVTRGPKHNTEKNKRRKMLPLNNSTILRLNLHGLFFDTDTMITMYICHVPKRLGKKVSEQFPKTTLTSLSVQFYCGVILLYIPFAFFFLNDLFSLLKDRDQYITRDISSIHFKNTTTS